MTAPEPGGIVVPTAFLPVVRELLADALDLDEVWTRTDEEWAAVRAQQDAEKARQLAAAAVRHGEVRARLAGPLAGVLDLHGPALPEHGPLWPVCEGCDADGYDAEPPEWPCRTWTLIAEEDA